MLFNTQQNGRLSYSEFANVFAAVGIHVPDEVMARLFHEADLRGVGDVDRNGFFAVFYPVGEDRKGRKVETGFQPASMLLPREAFDLFDTTGSGSLGKYEFQLLVEFLGLELSGNRSEALLAKFGMKDGHKDRLTYEAFVHIWARIANARDELGKRKKKKGRFDK